MTMTRPRCGKPIRKYTRPGQQASGETGQQATGGDAERVCWLPEDHGGRCMSKEAYDRLLAHRATVNKTRRPRYRQLRRVGYGYRDAERLSSTENSTQRALEAAARRGGRR